MNNQKLKKVMILTEEEWCICQMGSNNLETYEAYVKRMEEED